MMTISLSDAGKRFNREWIFRNLNYQFQPGKAYAIIGPNGSGKSTLLQAIAGAIALSEGSVGYQTTNGKIETDKAYQYLSIAAPYLELIEEMTTLEFLSFHEKFKAFLPGLEKKEIVQIVGLEKAAHKQIRYFSSGMKQRLRLAQAIFSNTPVLFLDEPSTNLDVAGISLYQELIAQYCGDRLVVVASNDPQEYAFCTSSVNIMAFK